MKNSLSFLCLLCSVLVFTSTAFGEQLDSSSGEKPLNGEIKRVFAHIQAELEAGREVQIRSFGTFYAKQREARVGRNPKTGEDIQIPARRYPRFRSSEALKRSLNSL